MTDETPAHPVYEVDPEEAAEALLGRPGTRIELCMGSGRRTSGTVTRLLFLGGEVRWVEISTDDAWVERIRWSSIESIGTPA